MPETAILIASFDKNRDLWKLFDFFFQKYWPECPYPIYLGANGQKYPADVPSDWKYINKGPDKSWSESMLHYAEAIPTETVLLLLDDYLLTGRPDVERIKQAVKYTSNEAVYVRLNPEPRPRKKWIPNRAFGELRYFDRYRASLKAAIWNKQFLINMLSLQLDPWTFELTVGAMRPNREKLFLGAFDPMLPNRHCVESGKYTYWLPDFLEEEGCTLRLNPDRPVLSWDEYVKMFGRAGKVKRRIVEKIPSRLYYLYQKLKRDV